MNQAIPTQHPAVVLRSHYLHLRALLAIATIAIVGLTIAVVVLAATNSSATSATPSVRVSSPAATGAPASAVSCGDVCSSYRHTPATATPPTPASAVSCGDVCSSYRQAR
jgi:hypothetical protein